MIAVLKEKQHGGQPIREDGPESHLLTKKGTPTMGGLMILASVTVATLLWADLKNGFVWTALLLTFSYGLIGFLDDYLKVSKHTCGGLPGKLKLLLQFSFAGIAVWYVTTLTPEPVATSLTFPFLKKALLDLWIFTSPLRCSSSSDHQMRLT